MNIRYVSTSIDTTAFHSPTPPPPVLHPQYPPPPCPRPHTFPHNSLATPISGLTNPEMGVHPLTTLSHTQTHQGRMQNLLIGGAPTESSRGGGGISRYLRYDLFQTITEMGSRHQIVPIRYTYMYVLSSRHWYHLLFSKPLLQQYARKSHRI